jgi:hypothetical protein
VPDKESRELISTISAKDYRDYEFIVNEIIAFTALSPQDQLNQLRADPWGGLSGLKGAAGGDLFLSKEGRKRVSQIATRGLKNLGPAGHFHRLANVITALKREWSTLILSGFEMTPENAHEVFDSAIRKLEMEYSELTYYVPCSVVAERTYAKFTIGPATFVLRDHFLKENEAAIRQAVAGFGNPEISETMFARTHSFYSEFQWVASITVPACDKEISRQRAHTGIQKALDVFKLIVGSDRAAHVKLAYDLTGPSSHAELVSSTSGVFALRMGGKGRDAITNDQWYQQVVAGPALPLLQSVLSNYWVAWRGLDEIQTRFIDALSWHSDAISEPDPGAKIVKFWTSIERLLSTSPGANIAARAAALLSNGAAEFEERSKEFEGLYQRRSAVVHGGANRASESWYEESAKGSEAASKNTLFQYLFEMFSIRAFREQKDRSKLAAWLKRLDDTAKHFRAQGGRKGGSAK